MTPGAYTPSRLLVALALLLDDYAPCDADLDGGTNGAPEWQSLRAWLDDTVSLQRGEAERIAEARSGVHAPDYIKSCRKGPHLTIAHRGGTWSCACPCHLGNEGRAWWPT